MVMLMRKVLLCMEAFCVPFAGQAQPLRSRYAALTRPAPCTCFCPYLLLIETVSFLLSPETFFKLKCAAFDKTGTLTSDHLSLPLPLLLTTITLPRPFSG